MQKAPTSGVKVTIEGSLTRLLFDFTKAEPVVQEGETAPDDLFNCESVDVNGRSKADIVSAIVNDRYSADQFQAILANYSMAMNENADLTDEKREEYLGEYEAFQEWRLHAKQIATIAVSLMS